MSELNFSKYEGTGNDFVLVDDRNHLFSIDSEKIVKLCHRQYGIGSDGLILLRPSEHADFSMCIFNRDGSEAQMCGNGLRCLVQFLIDLGEKKKTFCIEIHKKIYSCIVKDGLIYIDMGVPAIVETQRDGIVIDAGTLHFVRFVEELATFDQEAQQRFSTIGININYAKIESFNTIRMRTFERGVEQETLSCGSGATATCMVAWSKFGFVGPVKVMFSSGETLHFELFTEAQNLKGITMQGKVRHVFDGKMGT